jgi:secondary thiamine-phosphate synthase enzyme
MLKVQHIFVETTAKTDVIDLTTYVKKGVEKSNLKNGTITLFVPGSTACLTTIEYENGVIEDLVKAIERMVPEDMPYAHNERWGDGNGFAHVRAALVGPSLHIPLIDGEITLGMWQQIVLLDFDNKPKQRRIIMQIAGE